MEQGGDCADCADHGINARMGRQVRSDEMLHLWHFGNGRHCGDYAGSNLGCIFDFHAFLDFVGVLVELRQQFDFLDWIHCVETPGISKMSRMAVAVVIALPSADVIQAQTNCAYSVGLLLSPAGAYRLRKSSKVCIGARWCCNLKAMSCSSDVQPAEKLGNTR